MPLRRLSKNLNLSRLVSIASIACVFSSQVAWATSFGPLQGSNEMGRPLRLHTDLSNLNDDAKGQLRSTCMSASFIPSQEGGASGFDNRVQPLFVDFVPDGKVGGQVFLKSREVISDPVGTVRLRSECPLAVFEVTWSVLLDPSRNGGESTPKTNKSSLQADSDFRDFNFDSSASLERTLRLSSAGGVHKTTKKTSKDEKNTELASNQLPESKPKVALEKEKPVDKSQQKNQPMESVAVKAMAENKQDVIPTKSENAPTQELVATQTAADHTQSQQPDELALLDQKLADVNLIPSANQHALPGATDPLGTTDNRLPNAIQVNDIPLLIGVGALLMLIAISGFWFYRQRQLQPARAPQPKVSPVVRKQALKTDVSEPFFDPVVHGGDVGVLEHEADTEDVDKEDVHTPPNPLMLNSFLGVDTPVQDESQISTRFEHRAASKTSQGPEDSLGVVLSMVNRADAQLWKLPESYEPLVEARNKSLALSASPQSRVLRTQIGLLELAYQEATHNRILQQDLMEGFVQTMLEGVDLGVVEVDRETVPDVIHNYLSAKFCEVSGSQEKSCFKANCLALALIAEQWPMCFDSTQWEELVNESSVGG